MGRTVWVNPGRRGSGHRRKRQRRIRRHAVAMFEDVGEIEIHRRQDDLQAAP